MIIKVWFSEAGAAKTGISPLPTIDITDVADGSLDINDAAMTELANGWYKYDFSAFSALKEYVYLADGGAGLSDPERYIVGEPKLNVWDEVLTGASHNTATTAGRRLRELSSISVRNETAQAGSATTITLDGSASSTDEIYVGNIIVIIGGTGIQQSKTIVNYVGSTKVATIDGTWLTNPDATSEFVILATHDVEHLHHGVAQAGANGSITLDSGASAVNDFYNDTTVHTVTGTGAYQCRLISDYDGSSKIATVTPDWETNPVAGTIFHIGCRTRTDVALIEGETTRIEYLDKLMIALVNKLIITETTGAAEQFNDSDVSLGSIAAAFSSDGTFTTRKRMVI